MSKKLRYVLTICTAVVTLMMGQPVGSAGQGRASKAWAIVDAAQAKAEQDQLQRLLWSGGLVVVQGVREAEIESLLAVKLPVRLGKNSAADKSGFTPSTASAMGVVQRQHGGYHVVYFFGEVTDGTVARNVTQIQGLAGNRGSGYITPATITNSPCYGCTTGQVVYDYKPYGQVVSAWSLARTIATSGEHIWTAQFTDNITPGYALQSYGYGAWDTNHFRPLISVSYSGQQLRDAGPATVGSDGTFSVSLGYKTASASWAWNVPSVSVTETCNWTGNTCNWDFNYATGSRSQRYTTKQVPGVMATNTLGNFVIWHSHATEWIGGFWSRPTSSDGYTLSVTDF